MLWQQTTALRCSLNINWKSCSPWEQAYWTHFSLSVPFLWNSMFLSYLSSRNRVQENWIYECNFLWIGKKMSKYLDSTKNSYYKSYNYVPTKKGSCFAFIMGRFASMVYIYFVVCGAIPWLADKDFQKRIYTYNMLGKQMCMCLHYSQTAGCFETKKILTDSTQSTAPDTASSFASLSQQSHTNGSLQRSISCVPLFLAYMSHQKHLHLFGRVSFGRVPPHLHNLCSYGEVISLIL